MNLVFGSRVSNMRKHLVDLAGVYINGPEYDHVIGSPQNSVVHRQNIAARTRVIDQAREIPGAIVITSYSIHYTKLYEKPVKWWSPLCAKRPPL